MAALVLFGAAACASAAHPSSSAAQPLGGDAPASTASSGAPVNPGGVNVAPGATTAGSSGSAGPGRTVSVSPPTRSPAAPPTGPRPTPPSPSDPSSPAGPPSHEPSGAPSTNPPIGGWLAGSVVAVPGCPGPVVSGQECPPRPVPGAAVEVTGGTRPLTAMTADASGTFRVQLAPGTYTVKATNIGGYRSTTTQTVVMGTAGVVITLTVDSGMR